MRLFSKRRILLSLVSYIAMLVIGYGFSWMINPTAARDFHTSFGFNLKVIMAFLVALLLVFIPYYFIVFGVGKLLSENKGGNTPKV